MTKHSVLFFVVIVAFAAIFSSCEDDIPEPTENKDPISFSSLVVGQSNKYLAFEGENYYGNDNFSYEYRADTLIVEVIEELAANRFLIREYLSPNSISITDSSHFYFDPNLIAEYVYRIEGDTLYFDPKPGDPYISESFNYLYESNRLYLPDLETEEVEILGWKTSFPYCECYYEGFTTDFQLLGATYNRLNVVRDDQAMVVDGPGITTVYSAEHGLVRRSVTGWWTQTGDGWDLIGY